VSFAYSPVFEAALSLHVLARPKHHALQHGWVRRVRRLPVDLRKRVDAFRFAVFTDVPDFLLPSTDGGFLSFEEELERLRALDPELVAFEFLRPLYDHGGERAPALLRDATVRAHVERAVARLGCDPELALLIFDDPVELRERFLALLSDYWTAAFAADNKLSLVLSAYVWPHVRVNCDPPFPISLVNPAPFLARDLRPQIADSELLQLLRALAEETRLRALQLIAEAPRSTRELAPLLDISEAGLSKHLRLLADAGVLESHREGYYVVYKLVPERLDQISRTLVDYVNRPGASS